MTIYLHIYVKNGKNSEGLYPEGIRVMVRKEIKKKSPDVRVECLNKTAGNNF